MKLPKTSKIRGGGDKLSASPLNSGGAMRRGTLGQRVSCPLKKAGMFAAFAATALFVVTTPSSARAGMAALAVSVGANDVSVSVPAGVLDDTSALYLVWDTDDRGSNLENWPAENRIAYSGSPAISSAATYTISRAAVPAGAFMRVVATSNVRLIGGYVKLGAGRT